MATRLERTATTGGVLIEAGPLFLKSAILAAGSANATVLIQDTSAGGGTDVISLSALANSSVVWRSGDRDGTYFSAGIYATMAGTGSACTVEYEK